jgi:hypothetical protein
MTYGILRNLKLKPETKYYKLILMADSWDLTENLKTFISKALGFTALSGWRMR